MRKKWFSLGCLTSFVLLLLFLFFLGRAVTKIISKGAKKENILPNSTLYLNLKGQIPEYSIINENFFGKRLITVHSIIQSIKTAKKDPDIQRIIIFPEFIAIGYANLDDIATALKDFKTSGKKVYAYLEIASTKDYYLASVADKIYLNPSSSAGILLKGIGVNAHFYKNLLDKIGIDVNVIHAGKYKGYGENYSRTKFSKPVKQNLNMLLDGIYNSILKDISANRNLSLEKVKNAFENRDQLFINKENALKSGLVDVLKEKQDMFDDLDISDKRLVNITRYKRHLNYFDKNDKIAVVYAEGAIMKSISQDSPYKMKITARRYNKIFKKLKENKKVKAVVIRVNSPGGSALESEIILNGIKKLKSVKPVIVSMGNVAASGGYYISSNADYIYADKYTITGSIGVVAMIPKAKKLADKVGITSDKIQKGKYIGFFDLFSETKSEDIALLRKSIQDTYWEFKTRVSEGRKIPVTKVEEIAQGQVWNSNDALKRKLIDKIGNLDDAIQKAVNMTNLQSWSVEYYPKRKSYLQYILDNNFNLNVLSAISGNNIFKDIKFEKAYRFYNMIKEDHLQMLYTGELN